MKRIVIRGKAYGLPLYFPDATYGAVRSLDSQDIANCGIKGMVVNTYHLSQNPGLLSLEKAGGVKKLMSWPGLIVSDSGGFQFLSLFYKNPDLGKITDQGIRIYSGPKQKSVTCFTPQLSIKTQFAIGSDIMICLDDCPLPDSSKEQQRISIERTVKWAKECKAEFDRQCKKHKYTEYNRPILLAVIQGGNSRVFRTQCAKQLTAMDFDGYAFGGWPVKENKKLDLRVLKLVRDLTPKTKPLFALGIGKPQDIIACRKMGYDLFDCVLPTRDARHGRIYMVGKNKTSYLDIEKSRHASDRQPLDRNCRCHTCQNYSRSYLHHLFKMKELSAFRLATIHNLTAYANLVNRL